MTPIHISFLLLIHLTSTTTAIYAYDALGRRVSKTMNGVTTQFLHDGDQLIADLDAAGKLLARYVYGPGIDEPLVMLRGGKPYYFHADALGSIIALTDNRGQIIETYRYDAFGTPTILSPDGQVRATSFVGNRFLFTGREYDQETGLYFYRERYYDPRLGRFLQRDSLGDLSDENLYRYAGNNPTNWTDPFGLLVVTPQPPLPPLPRPVPGTEAGNKLLGGKPVGVQQPETGQNMAEAADAAEEQAKGQGEKKDRGLDAILDNWQNFWRWLKRKLPSGKPYSAQDARKIWDKLRETGLNPRLDPTSSRGKYWHGPHINVQAGGRNVHIPVSPDFQP